MPNLTYDIIEKSEINKVDVDEILSQVNLQDEDTEFDDDIVVLQIEYETNYTNKDLGYILDYYGINKSKMKKDEMIQNIIIFEKNPENSLIVYRRKELWYYVQELKDDTYFKKFILFTPPRIN
jgi:hypothetical protein